MVDADRGRPDPPLRPPSPTPSRDGRRPWWRTGPARALVVALWLALVGVVAVMALRVAPLDPPVPVLWAVTFLPLLVLALLGVLAAAALLRRRALVVATALALLAGVVLYAPDWGDGPHPVPEGWSTVRVLSANLLFASPSVAPLVDEVERTDPDVLVLQEVTAEHRAELERAGVLARYPHVVEVPDLIGTLIASRLVLRDPRTVDVGGRTLPLARLETPAGEVDLVGVHLSPPTFGATPWAQQLRGLRALVGELDRPLLVGDFNATSDHHGFRRLLAAGLVDGHQHAGQGFGMTWPVGRRLVPVPVLRIDHVLAGDGLEVTSLVARDDPGSDHRLLVADVAVRPDVGSAA